MKELARFIAEHGNTIVNVTESYVCFEVTYCGNGKSWTEWAYARNMKEARNELGY